MIVLLLVTQNESELRRADIGHHLEWGVDHVAVADNASVDGALACDPDFAERPRARYDACA